MKTPLVSQSFLIFSLCLCVSAFEALSHLFHSFRGRGPESLEKIPLEGVQESSDWEPERTRTHPFKASLAAPTQRSGIWSGGL